MQNRKSRVGKGLGSEAAASGSQLRKIPAQKQRYLLRERALLVEQKDRLRAVQRYCGGHGRVRRGDFVRDESRSRTTSHFSSCRSQGGRGEEWEPA